MGGRQTSNMEGASGVAGVPGEGGGGEEGAREEGKGWGGRGVTFQVLGGW